MAEDDDDDASLLMYMTTMRITTTLGHLLFITWFFSLTTYGLTYVNIN